LPVIALCSSHDAKLLSHAAELTRDDRKKLYSNFGLLYPHGHNELSIAEDFDQIRAAMEKVPAYANVFNKVSTGVSGDAAAALHPFQKLCRLLPSLCCIHTPSWATARPRCWTSCREEISCCLLLR
jgi:hypothetical protein